jgi:hypothetical protein
MKLSRKVKRYFCERDCATAEVEVLKWEEMDSGVYEAFVLIKLTYLEEGTEMSCVWGWWTDHYWSVIENELPDYLERYCPAPQDVWGTLEEAIRIGNESVQPQTRNCFRPTVT